MNDIITCGGCNRVFAGRVLPHHDCDGSAFGELGQDAEKFERDRITGLPKTPQAVETFERQQDIAAMARARQPALVRAHKGMTPETLNQANPNGMPGLEPRYNGEHLQAPGPTHTAKNSPPARIVNAEQTHALVLHEDNRQEIAEVMRPMIREAFGELTSFLGDLKSDIQAQSDLMRHIEAPMEAVVDSHERAASSFETLRRDIFDGGVSKLEKILDTSGLAEQATKSERRLEAMVVRLETKIDSAFKAHADSMVQILHLLERLQARELRETKNRIQRAASSAVRRGPKV